MLLQDNISEIGRWVLTFPFSKEQPTELLGVLMSSAVLNDVLSKIDSTVQGEEKASKMVIYSAHAANIMGLLQMFHLYDALREPPSFGSALLIEVVERNGKLVVELRYNGKLWKLPDCPNEGDCLLESFIKMNQQYVSVQACLNGCGILVFFVFFCRRTRRKWTATGCPFATGTPRRKTSLLRKLLRLFLSFHSGWWLEVRALRFSKKFLFWLTLSA